MRKVIALLVVPLAVVASVLLTQGGCEEADNTASLKVEPSFVDLTRALVTNLDVNLTFTVVDGLRELSLPLKWTVSDPQLGTVVNSSGASASYLPNVVSAGGSVDFEPGVNSILVEDQYGAQGFATVAQ